jgi:hypothetical protein
VTCGAAIRPEINRANGTIADFAEALGRMPGCARCLVLAFSVQFVAIAMYLITHPGALEGYRRFGLATGQSQPLRAAREARCGHDRLYPGAAP